MNKASQNITWESELKLTPELEAMVEAFASMTNEELNAYIHSMATVAQSAESSQANVAMDAASSWFAAATIAENAGYTCAGRLIKNSIIDMDYSETNGIFANKIKASPEYVEWKQDITGRYIVFERYNDADLFFALHKVNIGVTGSSQGATVHINDTFDFDLITSYDSIFVTLVNDFAWLCQNTYVLHPIGVDVYFKT